MLGNSAIKYVFVLPAVIWVLAFTIFPLGYSLFIAFNKADTQVTISRTVVPMLDESGEPVLKPNGQPRTRSVVEKSSETNWDFVGLDNFRRMFSDRAFWSAMRVTAIFVGVAVPLQLTFGFFLALLFNRPIMGRSVLRAGMILPIFATPIAVGYLFFTIFFEEGGPLSWLNVPFLSDPDWALFSVILVDVWQWTPFCFLVLLAAIQSIPDELYEAAIIDGANGLDTIREIILPLLVPSIIIVLLLRLAEAIKVFDIPFALTGGGPGIATQSASFLAFRTGLRNFDLGYASAMAYVLLMLVMVVVLIFFRKIRGNDD